MDFLEGNESHNWLIVTLFVMTVFRILYLTKLYDVVWVLEVRFECKLSRTKGKLKSKLKHLSQVKKGKWKGKKRIQKTKKKGKENKKLEIGPSKLEHRVSPHQRPPSTNSALVPWKVHCWQLLQMILKGRLIQTLCCCFFFPGSFDEVSLLSICTLVLEKEKNHKGSKG